jgi:hypothetical protein
MSTVTTELKNRLVDDYFAEKLLSEKDVLYTDTPAGAWSWRVGDLPSRLTINQQRPTYAHGRGGLRLVVTSRVFDAPWFKATLVNFGRLGDHISGGESISSRPINASSAARLIGFLSQSLEQHAAAPSLAPLTEGGIQAEWHRGGLDVEILISDDDAESGVFVRDKATGDEIEFPLDPDRFRATVSDRLSVSALV